MAEAKEWQALAQGNSVFAQQLYNIIAKQEGNVFFSPISVHALLSMAFQGAKESTYNALSRVLNIADSNQAAEGYKEIMENLNNVSGVELSLVNKIYSKEGFTLKTKFKEVILNKFLSEVEAVNFGYAKNAAKKINDWIEGKTINKITDLFSPDFLDSDTRLVLVNAIHFKGNWKHKFCASQTKTEKFYLNDFMSIDVQMMKSTRHYYRYKNDKNLNAQVLELPYSNQNFSLFVILPATRDGITNLEKELAKIDLTKITENMYHPEVTVKLPKFKIEITNELEKPLAEMGLQVIFDAGNANFSDMLTIPEQLSVSKVIQKAFIEVDDEDESPPTGRYCPCPPPKLFVADHPFIFFLSYQSKTIILKGRMMSPTWSPTT